jgi:hypothetical protein
LLADELAPLMSSPFRLATVLFHEKVSGSARQLL